MKKPLFVLFSIALPVLLASCTVGKSPATPNQGVLKKIRSEARCWALVRMRDKGLRRNVRLLDLESASSITMLAELLDSTTSQFSWLGYGLINLRYLKILEDAEINAHETGEKFYKPLLHEVMAAIVAGIRDAVGTPVI